MSIRRRKWTHAGQVKEAWVLDYIDGEGTRRLETFKRKPSDRDRQRAARRHTHAQQREYHRRQSLRVVAGALQGWRRRQRPDRARII